MKLGKFFGLVSVTGLTGLVAASAACSNPVTEALQTLADAGPGGSLSDAGKGKKGSSGAPGDSKDEDRENADTDPGNDDDDAPPTKKDGGSEAGPGPGPGPGPNPDPNSCLDTTPINATLFPYKKAGVTPGACTNAELTTLSNYFKSQTNAGLDVSIASWSAQVSASCSKCVFSNGTGTTWTPIITSGDELANVNRGGCIEIKSGKESCGRAYQQVTECRLEACLSLCQTQAEFTACVQDAASIFGAGGPCKTAFDKMDLECGANLATYENACLGTSWTFEGPIKAQCINGN